MYLARECDRFPDMRDAADPRDRALDPQPEARVDERAVLPEVEVPLVRLGVEPLGQNPAEQPVVVVFPLRPADDPEVPGESSEIEVSRRSTYRLRTSATLTPRAQRCQSPAPRAVARHQVRALRW